VLQYKVALLTCFLVIQNLGSGSISTGFLISVRQLMAERWERLGFLPH